MTLKVLWNSFLACKAQDFVIYIRVQKYFNIALILQDEWLTIFTRPANTHTCHLKAYAIKTIRELYLIWLPQVICPKALILQDKCFENYYLSFLDFTRYYERTSGIFAPCKYNIFMTIISIHYITLLKWFIVFTICGDISHRDATSCDKVHLFFWINYFTNSFGIQDLTE